MAQFGGVPQGIGFGAFRLHIGVQAENPHPTPGFFSLCSLCEWYSAVTIFGPSWGPPQAGRDGPGPLRLCFRTLFGGSWKCLDVFNKEDSIRILVRFQTGMAQLGGVP